MKKKLPELCNIQYGYAFDSNCFTEDQSFIPIARIRDVKRGYSETFYSGTYPAEYVIHYDDLLVGMDGEFNIARWKSQNALLNQRVCKISAKTGTNEEYLRFCLSKSLKEIENRTSFVTVKHLSAKELNKLELDVPDISVQNTIANILSKLEIVIALQQQQLQALDDLIKARFVEMFGDPIINNRGWSQTTLLYALEPGRTVTYGIVQTGDECENGVPVFRPIDIAGGHVPRREELKRTDPSISAQYKRTLLKGNELLITVRGSVGETFQITKEFEGCNVGRNIVPLVTDSSKVLQRFLQELFTQDAIKRWLKGITKGIALQGLNMGEFKEMPVITPPIVRQKEFVDFAIQVDKSKLVVQKAMDEAQLLFDSLMQQYFG